jgi:hypothetical protein
MKHAVRISQAGVLLQLPASVCHVMHQIMHASYMTVHVHLQHDLL